jgi:hypothetical protein
MFENSELESLLGEFGIQASLVSVFNDFGGPGVQAAAITGMIQEGTT